MSRLRGILLIALAALAVSGTSPARAGHQPGPDSDPDLVRRLAVGLSRSCSGAESPGPRGARRAGRTPDPVVPDAHLSESLLDRHRPLPRTPRHRREPDA